MSRPRVVVTSPLFQPENQDALEPLRALECDVVFRHLPPAAPPEALIDALQGAHGVVASVERYSAQVLEACPELRIIARTGVGYDAIDLQAATRLGIAVTITVGANDRSVADFALALMLALGRRVMACDRAMRAGEWQRPHPPDFWESTIGIVGLGRIGKEVARRLGGFGCSLLAFDPVPDFAFAQACGVSFVPLDELLERSDFVTLHAALGQETRHLIGARELRRMKPTAYLVNTGRGGLVDEEALVRGLQEGWIAGAGLDVFELEPLPRDHPLRTLDNVILTPHAAGVTSGSVQRSTRMASESIASVLQGQPPHYCVNPEVLAAR